MYMCFVRGAGQDGRKTEVMSTVCGVGRAKVMARGPSQVLMEERWKQWRPGSKRRKK